MTPENVSIIEISTGYKHSLLHLGEDQGLFGMVDLNILCNYMGLPTFKSYQEAFDFPGIEEIIFDLLLKGKKLSSLIWFDESGSECLVGADFALLFVDMLENNRISAEVDSIINENTDI